MSGLLRRVVGVIDAVLIVAGVVLLALGVINGIAWLLGADLGGLSTNPTFLLDQRRQDKILTQVAIWIPAGLVLLIGGPILWSYLTLDDGRRIPRQRRDRAVRIAPFAIAMGLALVLFSAALAFLPLPQRTVLFTDQDFGPPVSTPSGVLRVSSAFRATSGEILTGVFRETFVDNLTGNELGPLVLNSSVSAVSDTYSIPPSLVWEYSVHREGPFAVIVGGDLGACPPSLGCPANYTSEITGHVTATAPASYTVEEATFSVLGVTFAVPPMVLWRVRYRKRPVGTTP